MVIKEDPIFLRASLSGSCNLDCIYCPKELGMENQVPKSLKGKKLSLHEYRNNLKLFADNGIKAITFTGGEPTLNKNIVEISKYARKIFERVEITTNGFRLQKYLNELFPYLDVIKFSIDAVDKKTFEIITNRHHSELRTQLESIELCCKTGINVALNVVVMKQNLNQLDKIISLAKEFNQKYNKNIYVSLLDFYFSSPKRKIWEENFIPLNILKERFTKRYGNATEQIRFGCQFFWFNANGVNVRFKDSYGATQRAEKCQTCKEYCQEGIFSIKHSVEGWITTCLSNKEELGEYLNPKLKKEELNLKIKSVLSDIYNSKTEINSFKKLLMLHNLNPKHLVNEK